MKKIILLTAIVIWGFNISESKAIIHTAANHFSMPMPLDSTWAKGTMWTGKSQNKIAYYKINPKNQVVFSSVNGKTWGALMGGTWMTKDGKKIKIAEKKLVWSADDGKTWTEVPDWTWIDADGDSCKFDAEWNLWIKKAPK